MNRFLFSFGVPILLIAASVTPAKAQASDPLVAEPPAAPATVPASRPSTQPSELAIWSGLEPGSSLTLRIRGSLRQADWKVRLKESTPDRAVLEVVEQAGGNERKWDRRLAAAPTSRPAAAATDVVFAEGTEALHIGAEKIDCHWVTLFHPTVAGKAPDGESGETVWTAPGIPGFVKKVTWLPADLNLGLAAAVVSERLVALDLHPRKVDGGEAGKVWTIAEVPPPKHFHWTYAFDPKGWRDWKKVNDGEWVEKWESGEEVHFRIDRQIDDGERQGTVVRRLPNEDLETVIPDDAQAGAVIWFRQLQGESKWTQLGEIEKSD